MPRHAKSTKVRRDRSMVAGIEKHSRELSPLNWGGAVKSLPAVAARFQAHLDALDEVAAREAAWRTALAREERLENEIKKLLKRVGLFLLSVYGDDSQTLRDFGIAPRKQPKMSVEKMLVTIAKRNATRKARHTMGSKQRKAI